MTITKLSSTYTSIINLIARGGTLQSQRGQTLVDRYNALRADLRSSDLPLWQAYCEEINACSSHDGYDLFA